MHPLKNALSQLTIGKPMGRDGLTLFPLLSEVRSRVIYRMLADGLREGLVTVRELSGEGSVPDLAVDNRSKQPVLILDGEELVGAKQNRVANLTMLLPGTRKTIIPVSCVEQGRWDYDTVDFAVTNRVQYARGRAARHASVRRSLARTGARRSNQGEVWNSIREKAYAMDAGSPTGAMSSIFERHAARLDEYVNSVDALPGQVGALFVVGNERFGLDLFDKPETFAAVLPRLVRSYAVDVIERPGSRPESRLRTDAHAFVESILEAPFAEQSGVGLGRDCGVVSEDLVAGALVVDDVVVHLTAFSNPGGSRRQSDGSEPAASYRERRRNLRRRYA